MGATQQVVSSCLSLVNLTRKAPLAYAVSRPLFSFILRPSNLDRWDDVSELEVYST